MVLGPLNKSQNDLLLQSLLCHFCVAHGLCNILRQLTHKKNINVNLIGQVRIQKISMQIETHWFSLQKRRTKMKCEFGCGEILSLRFASHLYKIYPVHLNRKCKYVIIYER